MHVRLFCGYIVVCSALAYSLIFSFSFFLICRSYCPVGAGESNTCTAGIYCAKHAEDCIIIVSDFYF